MKKDRRITGQKSERIRKKMLKRQKSKAKRKEARYLMKRLMTAETDIEYSFS